MLQPTHTPPPSPLPLLFLDQTLRRKAFALINYSWHSLFSTSWTCYFIKCSQGYFSKGRWIHCFCYGRKKHIWFDHFPFFSSREGSGGGGGGREAEVHLMHQVCPHCTGEMNTKNLVKTVLFIKKIFFPLFTKLSCTSHTWPTLYINKLLWKTYQRLVTHSHLQKEFLILIFFYFIFGTLRYGKGFFLNLKSTETAVF